MQPNVWTIDQKGIKQNKQIETEVTLVAEEIGAAGVIFLEDNGYSKEYFLNPANFTNAIDRMRKLIPTPAVEPEAAKPVQTQPAIQPQHAQATPAQKQPEQVQPVKTVEAPAQFVPQSVFDSIDGLKTLQQQVPPEMPDTAKAYLARAGIPLAETKTHITTKRTPQGEIVGHVVKITDLQNNTVISIETSSVKRDEIPTGYINLVYMRFYSGKDHVVRTEDGLPGST
jgi:hypothetical protein